MAGRGTAIERSPGRWRLTVNLGLDEKGKQIRQTKTIAAKNKKEAERQLARFVAALEENRIGDHERMPLKQFIDEHWLPDKKANLAPKTVLRYTDYCKRIITALGKHSLGDLKATHLKTFFRELVKSGARLDGKEGALSQESIHYGYRVFHAVLNDAVSWGYITQNAAKKIKVARGQKRTPRFYSPPDVEKLRAALLLEPLWLQSIIWLALTCGCREGELMGLEWRHIDLVTRELRIEQSAQYIPGLGNFIKEPKTENSRRTLKIPLVVIPLLQSYYQEQQRNKALLGDKWIETGHVFINNDGRLRSPTTMSKAFPKLVKRHNLSPLNFHGLRHTCATILINSGLSAPDVAKQLGDSLATVLNVYAHAFEKFNQRTSNAMDDYFNQSQQVLTVETTAHSSDNSIEVSRSVAHRQSQPSYELILV